MSLYYCDTCHRPHDGDAVESVVIETPARTLTSCLNNETELLLAVAVDCPAGVVTPLTWDGQQVHYPPQPTDDETWRELVAEYAPAPSPELSTNQNLRLLGYRTESVMWKGFRLKTIIAPDGTNLGNHDACSCSALLAKRHPEYFAKVRP